MNLLFQSHPNLASLAPMAAILDGNSSSSSSEDGEVVCDNIGRSRVKRYRNRMKTKNKPYNSRKEMLKHRQEKSLKKEKKRIAKQNSNRNDDDKKNKKKNNKKSNNNNSTEKEKTNKDNLDSLALFMKYSSFHTNEEEEQ